MPDVALTDLKPHPRNYNVHSDAQIARLAESLRRFGQSKEIVTWRGTIIAGHGLVEAARKLGWPTLRANDMTARWSETEALAYMAADNELARLADPDEAALAALVTGLAGVDAQLAALAAGTAERMKELLASTQPPPEDPGPQLDRAEELQAKWQTATGQLWELGAHRLICGDCTDHTINMRLMEEKADLLMTDPPYNVGIEYGSGSSDSKTIEQNETFILRWFGEYKDVPVKVITPGAGYYMGTLRSWLTLFPPRWLCLWLRRNSMSHSPLRGFAAWEPVLFYKNEEQDSDTEWGGVLIYGKPQIAIGQDVFDIPVGVQLDVQDDQGNKYHPTPKPVELFEVLLRRFSKPAQLIADPFLGSGTTLIACERLGRRCRAIEIEPKYVAVALERWATMTGRTPILIDDPVQPETSCPT